MPQRKYVFDRVAGSLLLLLTSPLVALLWAAIKLTSPGPGIFRQMRIGYDRQPFVIYKLRTMYCSPDQTYVRCTSVFDDRVTPLGRVLRHFKLDELPQFVNVVRGEMSLVGPRPHVPGTVDPELDMSPRYQLRYRCRPGVTSPGKLFGKIGDPSQIELEARYVSSDWRLRTDVVVIAQTVWLMTKRLIHLLALLRGQQIEGVRDEI